MLDNPEISNLTPPITEESRSFAIDEAAVEAALGRPAVLEALQEIADKTRNSLSNITDLDVVERAVWAAVNLKMDKFRYAAWATQRIEARLAAQRTSNKTGV